MLEDVAGRVADERRWAEETRARASAAEDSLLRRARELAG
jgi:hypothetical protein